MNFIIKGDICYSESPQKLHTSKNSYLICEDDSVIGVFKELPDKYSSFPATDYENCLVIPGLTDLHVHAPQYSYRGLGMDMQLLDWLKKYTFPEEEKFSDIEYADKVYSLFADAIKNGATTRTCVYATIHKDATLLLMEKLEQAGIVSMVGLVEMDRNCPEALLFDSVLTAYERTKSWIVEANDKYKNAIPIITPRFIPSCSDELMHRLKELQTEFSLPVQSHLSESKAEIKWVRELCPNAETYSQAYEQFGLFGGDSTPTVMAHCVWLNEFEQDLIKQNGVYIAHCPQSNTNLSSGIAPIRKYMDKKLNIGLGSDVAGGCHLSIFRAMADAVQVSKLHHCIVDENDAPLTINEAFYLGTAGGGSFFGNVGSFEAGFEFDAIVIDDNVCTHINPLTIEERLAKLIYTPSDSQIIAKYVKGVNLDIS